MISLHSKKIKWCILAGTCALLLTGCTESHADTPEFTTNSDRDTGFVHKTFQQKHKEEANEEAEKISDEVDNGINSVKEKAAAMSEELETADMN